MITHNAIKAIAGLLFAASFVTAAPFEIEGPIKEVKKIDTKPPYTFDDKLVVSLTIVGHRFGKDFDYQYMIVEGTTELDGISFADLKPGKYVRIKGRAEPPGMVGKPINEIRDSRYGLCNFALRVDTVATPRNLTASITRVESFGPGEVVVTVRETSEAPEFKYAVAEGKTKINNGVLADLKVSTKIDIAHASINVPVPAEKDHGKLHGADLYASTVTLLKGPHIMTVDGPIEAASAGLTLSHEHVLVDFIGADQCGPHRYDADKVFEKVRPHLTRAHELGTRMFIECTPEFIGRDPKLLRRLSEAADLHILTNTGLYGARYGKFLPPYAATETAEQLAARWIAEACDGIEGTGIRPGFIKVGVNIDAELSAVDRKIVEAAAIAHRATGLIIAVHTGAGPGLMQLEILKAAGVSPAAWIWVHAQNAEDADILAAAKQGAWVSFDGIGPETLDRHLDLCKIMRDENMLDQVLISHDAGWYDPGKPEGGTFRDFQLLFTEFLPMLKAEGFTDAEIDQLLNTQPRPRICHRQTSARNRRAMSRACFGMLPPTQRLANRATPINDFQQRKRNYLENLEHHYRRGRCLGWKHEMFR
jgi:predicted metal-dependent phosphotriesterase family hydrolase